MYFQMFKDEKQFRLPSHDYSSDGYYFVTICTKKRKEFFGEIKNGIMGLNEIGVIAIKSWKEIPNYFKDVELDIFQIMPNHLHGILAINLKDNDHLPPCRNTINPGIQNTEVKNGNRLTPCRNTINRVPTNTDNMNNPNHRFMIQNNPMKTDKPTIGKIIRWFKGRTSFEIHKINPNFAWQPRFWDSVIRDENELNRIREYIHYNPYKWELDRNNPENLWM